MEHEGLPIEIVIAGVRHSGRYTADRHGVITVWHPELGERITQRNGMDTVAVARSVLKRMVRERGERIGITAGASVESGSPPGRE
jgi:hypothetical protein